MNAELSSTVFPCVQGNPNAPRAEDREHRDEGSRVVRTVNGDLRKLGNIEGVQRGCYISGLLLYLRVGQVSSIFLNEGNFRCASFGTGIKVVD